MGLDEDVIDVSDGHGFLRVLCRFPYVAQNTYAEYRFIARGHTAYKLKLKRQSESIGVTVDVLNPANNTLASVYNESTGKDHLIGFGTVDAGEHIIRISGFRGVGTYHITLEEVSSY